MYFKMIVLKNQFLRKSSDLKVQLLWTKKQILIEGILGSFLIPVATSFLYSKKHKKIRLTTFSRKNKVFINLFHVLLLQSTLGVLLGYRKQLNIVGIGYQATVENNNTLLLKLGYSHFISLNIPSYLIVSCPKPRVILLKGINLQKINNYASVIRKLKLPSSYKEKGIYFFKEIKTLKQGKKT